MGNGTYQPPVGSPSSAKSADKLRNIRKSRVILEGDAEAIERKFVPKDVRYVIFQIIMLVILCVALLIFWQYWSERSAAQGVYEEVAQTYIAPEPEELPPVQEQQPDTSSWPPIVNFDELRAANPDTVGWIRIPGTDVDYPVMMNEERDYYLNRDMYGNYSISGSIFLDYQNTRDPDADNHIVIYGHHMNWATMFHAVSLYGDRAFFDSHRVIYFETPKNTYVLRPVGSYIADGSEYEARQTMFDSHQDFQRYLDKRMDRCTQIRYDDYNRRTIDKLITLVTCTNAGDSRQIVECVVEQVYPTSMIPVVIERALADQQAQHG